MAKSKRNPKPTPEQQENQKDQSVKKNLTGKFLDTLTDSLKEFSQLSEGERSIYGNQEFLDQFREYFKKESPSVSAMIGKDDLPGYLELLEKKGFTIAQFRTSGDKFHKEFASEKPEREVMQDTLKQFDSFCKDGGNAMPAGVFKKFADEAGFDHQSYAIPRTSTLQTIDDLYLLWKKFIEKENISLKDNQKKNIEHLLCPVYDPVERVMVQVAIDKIRTTLPASLRGDFDVRFHGPITAFSSLQDLGVFKNEWIVFLESHQHQIDKPLAKKLDQIIVTNGDIKKHFLLSGKKFDIQASYSEWEKYFTRVFDRLATRQLFEEVKDTQEAIEKYVDVITETARGFPPYMNEIFKLYPYDDSRISLTEPAVTSQLQDVDTQISQIELSIAHEQTSKEEKIHLRKKRKELRQERELIKWNAYISYLATKDPSLSAVMGKVVTAHFDMGQLSLVDQQVILNHLVKHKLQDLIQHKAPELLDIDAESLQQFVEDLFDLQKMELMIPTKEDPVHIKFAEKKFISQKAQYFLSVNNLADMQSFPLQFTVVPTPSSQDFFEQGVLRGREGGQLFDTFESADGPRILNDGYKVKLSKDGKTAQGYLSSYPPADVDEESPGTRWYLYSHPITDISEERSLVTREGTSDGTRVIVDEQEEKNYHLDVLDRLFLLNGQAIGSLLFAYILGQQSLQNEITPDQEKKLAKKLGKLDTFKDMQGNREQQDGEEQEVQENKPVETKEKTDYDKFLDKRKDIPGYNFPADTKEFGFTEGTRIYMKVGESALPPHEESSDAWMYLDIKKINKTKGTFVTTLHGGESALGQFEGVTKELSLKDSSLDSITEIFGSEIYKVPAVGKKSFDDQLDILKKVLGTSYTEKFAYTFDTINSDGNGFKFTQGDFAGEKVAAFGYDSKVPKYNDKAGRTLETIQSHLFDVKRNADGTFHISYRGNLVDEKGKKLPKFVRDMDPVSFALFIAGKKLQPKACKDIEEKKDLKTKESDEDKGFQKKNRPFSINNIIGFFKTGVTKVKDSIKKYDEERTEDLTDVLLQNGAVLTKFGKMRGGLSMRIGTSFETAGVEYYTTRDARIWKKIEKWQKVYEQEKHYPSFFFEHLNTMLTGKEVPKDIYKIPAMLLTIINKEKSPYARHFDLIGKGHRVNLILGKGHQDRYLDILNRKLADLRQNSGIYGSGWTVNRNEEIMKLEMKYIIAVIDGREHSLGDVHEKQQAAKWSRNFAEKLDEAMNTKFGKKSIDDKLKDIDPNSTFEFLEYEYARQTKTNKPANAFPNLQAMAKQAQTPAQWRQFEMHIVSGILSGWFLNGADAGTQGWIKDMCRSRGFLPGLWAKDIHQQSKMLTLLNVFLKSKGKKFEDFEMIMNKKSIKFSLSDFTLGKMENVGFFIAEGFKKRRFDNNNGSDFSKFLEITGKDAAKKKTLLELASDPTLSESERSVLKEYITNGNESSEDLDPEVRKNPTAVSGTPFTKCETIVRELMKYENGDFDGKDSLEKAGPARFREKVATELPKGPTSQDNLTFFIKKFFNWFGGCGFSDSNKTIFLKRLYTIQTMFKDPRLQKQAEDMLRYTINGTILSMNGAGKGTTPDALTKALNAFKSLFKDNIDTILSPNIISATMGDFYAKDQESNTPYKIGDRGEYMMVKTRAALIGKGSENRANISRKYASGSYTIYEDLYGVAENLVRKAGLQNRFKSYYNREGSTDSSSGEQNESPKLSASGVAITNPKRAADQIHDTLSGKGKKRAQQEQKNQEILSTFDDEEY